MKDDQQQEREAFIKAAIEKSNQFDEALCRFAIKNGLSPFEIQTIHQTTLDGHKMWLERKEETCSLPTPSSSLDEEGGASLRAAGWKFDCISEGGDWNVPSRGGRRTDQPQQPKQRWFKALSASAVPEKGE